MSRIKTIPLTLVAVVAFSAIIVTSASALPEFIKKAGTYPIKFTGKATSPETLPPKLKSSIGTIECKNESSEGEFSENGMEVKKIDVRYTGCKGPLGVICTTSGQASGTIAINELMGSITYDSEAKKTNVLALLPASIKLETTTELEQLTVAEFECSGTKIVVKGTGVVGEITNINVITKEFKLKFNGSPTQEFSTVVLLANNSKGEKIEHLHVELAVNEGKATLTSEETITLPAGVEAEIKN